jgi:hypothetical protein
MKFNLKICNPKFFFKQTKKRFKSKYFLFFYSFIREKHLGLYLKIKKHFKCNKIKIHYINRVFKFILWNFFKNKLSLNINIFILLIDKRFFYLNKKDRNSVIKDCLTDFFFHIT